MERLATLVRAHWRRLVRDRNGGVAVLTAMTLTSMLGVAGLGTEATLWYVAKRNAQGAADAAAFTASTASAAGQNSTKFIAAAKAVAAGYGFVDGSNGVVVTVNNPPHSGAYTSNASAIEVIVQQSQPMLFSQLFLASAITISSRAVAAAGSNGDGCVVALDKGNITDISDSGGATLNLNACSLYVNSPNADALSMSGGAVINDASTYISGNYQASGGAKLNSANGTHTGAAPINDPYASVPVPSYSGCNKTNYSLSGGASATLSAGGVGSVYVFCNGLSLSGGSTLTLNPGIYVIDRGSFSLSGGTTLNASGGVTFVFTSSTGSSYATTSISGGANVNVTAPSTGTTAGIAFYQDRNAPATGSDSFSGGATQNITGAIYYPDQAVSFSGGTATGGAQCTQLIALKLSFSGGTNLSNNCSGTGVQSIGGSATQLVE